MSKRLLFLNSLFINVVRLNFAAVMIAGLSTAAIARPTGLGIFSAPDATGKGSYTTATGSKGSYVITPTISSGAGYDGYEFKAGENGLQVLNKALQGDKTKDKDKFGYKITLFPENTAEVHNILVAQSGYESTGNSEIAKQMLSYEPGNTALETKAVVASNPNVAFFYDAMGDYFMGKKITDTSASARNAVSAPQLRIDSSASSPLYYFNIKNIQGATESAPNSNIFTLPRGALSLQRNVSGVLPPNSNIDGIFKASASTASASSYAPLSTGAVIANGSSYVSFGIENTVSDYLIKVNNAKSVTLNYQGIMNGNIGVNGGVFGETYNEWITFGVTSEPTYKFSGIVFNDNGSITNENANNAGSPYKENTKYFNGVLDEGEAGITGSTIQLINCTDITKVYNETNTDASGNYNFTIAQSLLPKDKVCIKESSAPVSHPVATSPSLKTIPISTNTTNYMGNNFGRVIAKNAPLVLEKLQFANKCDLDSLVENSQNSIIYSKDPVNASNPNVAPMNCIAYKLIATNRANLAIDNVVIQDRLAQKGMGDALITSTLTDNNKRVSIPATPTVSFNDGLADGQNGTVKTAGFKLNAKGSRSFYFNTKYGTTQSP